MPCIRPSYFAVIFFKQRKDLSFLMNNFHLLSYLSFPPRLHCPRPRANRFRENLAHVDRIRGNRRRADSARANHALANRSHANRIHANRWRANRIRGNLAPQIQRQRLAPETSRLPPWAFPTDQPHTAAKSAAVAVAAAAAVAVVAAKPCEMEPGYGVEDGWDWTLEEIDDSEVAAAIVRENEYLHLLLLLLFLHPPLSCYFHHR